MGIHQPSDGRSDGPRDIQHEDLHEANKYPRMPDIKSVINIIFP